jgi:replication factor A1
MEVKDLEVRKAVDKIELEITDMEAPREWSNARGQGRVANAKAKDKTGEVSITFWNDDIAKVKKGNKITIENGWCSEFQGEKQLSTGKFGKLTVQ